MLLSSIQGKGRAADGRRMAAMAVELSIYLYVGLFLFMSFAGVMAGQSIGNIYILFLFGLLINSAAIWGIKHSIVWIGVVYGVYCLLDILSSLNLFSGIWFVAIFDLISAVLSFVALSGIVIWVRNRSLNVEMSL